MATTVAHSSVTAVVRDGGTVVAGGTPASDSPITNNINVNDLNTGVEYGSKVLAMDGTGGSTTDPDGVTTAGASTLAYFPSAADRNFIIRHAGSTAAGKINNSSNSLLNVVGADWNSDERKGQLHGTIGDDLLGSAADYAYDVLAVSSTERVPGRTKGTGAGNDLAFTDAIGGAAAASHFDTHAIPGELTYMFGAPLAARKDYKSRHVYES
jgi:hypothetical protein|tara:strand:- start:2326 stop:2958 length:633 start_codon:yes stop_codon:yes gene_type:complete